MTKKKQNKETTDNVEIVKEQDATLSTLFEKVTDNVEKVEEQDTVVSTPLDTFSETKTEDTVQFMSLAKGDRLECTIVDYERYERERQPSDPAGVISQTYDKFTLMSDFGIKYILERPILASIWIALRKQKAQIGDRVVVLRARDKGGTYVIRKL